jgi:hypothetical protein
MDDAAHLAFHWHSKGDKWKAIDAKLEGALGPLVPLYPTVADSSRNLKLKFNIIGTA